MKKGTVQKTKMDAVAQFIKESPLICASGAFAVGTVLGIMVPSINSKAQGQKQSSKS